MQRYPEADDKSPRRSDRFAPRSGALQPPRARSARKRIGAEISDHPLAFVTGRPGCDAMEREPVNQVGLAGPSGDDDPAARLEALPACGRVRFGDVLVEPTLGRHVGETLAERAAHDLVRAFPDDERSRSGGRVRQRNTEDETVRLAEPAPLAFRASDAVHVRGVPL